MFIVIDIQMTSHITFQAFFKLENMPKDLVLLRVVYLKNLVQLT